jgi:hypothetical protein
MWYLAYKLNDLVSGPENVLFHTTGDLIEYVQQHQILLFSCQFVPIWKKEEPKSAAEVEESRKRRQQIPEPLSNNN